MRRLCRRYAASSAYSMGSSSDPTFGEMIRAEATEDAQPWRKFYHEGNSKGPKHVKDFFEGPQAEMLYEAMIKPKIDQYKEHLKKRHVPLTKLIDLGDVDKKPKKDLYDDIRTATVWVPMQEISMMQLFKNFEDDIPPEYRKLAEEQAKNAVLHKKSDISPAFTTLDDKPDAPTFLPFFETEKQCGQYLSRQFEKNPEIDYFMDKVKATDMISMLLESPEEVVIGFRGTWIAKQDFSKALPQEAIIEPEDSDDVPEDSDDCDDESAHTEELHHLINSCISFLKCARWSVRYVFLTSNEVAGEELLTISVEMATWRNTSPDSPAMLPRGKRKLNKIRQHKIKRIIKYLRKKRVKFRLGIRKETKKRQRDEDHDPVLQFNNITAALLDLPKIQEFKRQYFLSIKEVHNTDGTLDQMQPFYDNMRPYNEIPRAFVSVPAEKSLRKYEKNSIPEHKMNKLVQDHYSTLKQLREKDLMHDDATTINKLEMDLMTEVQTSRVVFGPSPWIHSHSDKLYNLSEKEYTLITKGTAAADKLGPPGYTFKTTGFDEDLGSYMSSMMGVPTEKSLGVETVRFNRLKRERNFRKNAAERYQYQHRVENGRWR